MKLGLVILLWATCAFGQSLIPSYEPEQLAEQLKNVYDNEWNCKDAAEKCESVAQGDLIRKELHTSSDIRYCDKIGVTHVRFDGLRDAGFVQMQCGWNLNLVFTQNTGTGWQFLQTIIIPNHSEAAKVSVASVTGSDSQEVLVHHSEYVGGTGVFQENFIVCHFDHKELRMVLNAVESGYIAVPWTKHKVSQESRFVFQPASPAKAGFPETAPTFEETQILTLLGSRVELKRDFTWSKEDQLFVASQWLSARTLPTAKKATKSRK